MQEINEAGRRSIQKRFTWPNCVGPGKFWSDDPLLGGFFLKRRKHRIEIRELLLLLLSLLLLLFPCFSFVVVLVDDGSSPGSSFDWLWLNHKTLGSGEESKK